MWSRVTINEIRDKVFDVDKNKVKIIVVCCSPEQIRDKLCYKGGGSIQSIEIIEKPAEKPKDDKPKTAGVLPKETAKPNPTGDKPKDAGKSKEAEKPKPVDKPKEVQKPKPADKPKESGKPAEPEKAKPKEGDKPAGPNTDVAKMVYEPVHGYPQMYPQSGYPMMGYGQYYDHGYGVAPYQHGYGMPAAAAPPPGYGGFGYESGYNGNRNHYMSNAYGGEEDGEGCSIM
ncbi:hypothetical protein R6Q57_015880 [Mikania cordata]